MRLLTVFFWGMLISFIGSLPLGSLNIAAMQIGIQESIQQAIFFSLGSLTVEMIYVRISLVGIDWISRQARLMNVLQWITLAVIIALALGSFLAAAETAATGQMEKNTLLEWQVHRFLLGMMMSAINPVQIPFWFGWSTVLFDKKILEPKQAQYNTYIIGIGLGTLAGNAVFIFGGKWLTDRIQNSGQYINWIIGGVFTITAIIQLYRIFYPAKKKQSTTKEQSSNLST
jgi:threonine/homoserine/homoserine lactone efflux protein